ncbi:sigma factor [Wukongibacter sp. M2B1]|uniref:sigma factor n=1 Tax=Wukongibacter sp. M2B1 TaxID=3088895 RepID=UPI003D7A1853
MWLTIVSLPLLLLSAFVSNNTSFPKPLSSDEEEKYLKLYSVGDENAKNILIEKNLRLVAHVVKKYHNTGYNPDDLISIGTIGLIKAITTFDTGKGTRLATYAARCIENAILTKDHKSPRFFKRALFLID